MGMALGISGMLGKVVGGLMLNTSGAVPLMLDVGLIVSTVGLLLLLLLDRLRIRHAHKLS